MSDNPLSYGTNLYNILSQYAGSTTEGENAYIGPGRARVTQPSMLDVQPVYDEYGGTSSPALSNDEQQWLDIYNSLVKAGASQAVLDYHIAHSPSAALGERLKQAKALVSGDADVMMRAVQSRQRQERYPATND